MFWGKDGIESILDKYRGTSCSCEICMTVLKDSTLKLVKVFGSGSESDAAGIHLIFDELAKDLWKEKFYKKASIAFEIAYSVKPQNPMVLAHLASTAYNSGLMEKCQELCEDVASLSSDPCIRSHVAKLNYKVFLERETSLKRHVVPLRKVWDEAHSTKNNHKKNCLLLHGGPLPVACSCGYGSFGNTDEDDAALKLFLNAEDTSSSSDESSIEEEGRSPALRRFANGLRPNFDSPLCGTKWLSNHGLPSSKLANSRAAQVLTEKHGGVLHNMKSREQNVVRCEAIRSLHQKMYEDSVLRLSDHFHASSATPDLRYSGICFARDKTMLGKLVEPDQDWSTQYQKVQQYLAEKATAEVFLPNYETKSTLSTVEIDDALQSFSFIPKQLKEHEFERREVDEWIACVGMELFGLSFFSTKSITFERYFGPHLKAKGVPGKKKRRAKKAPCSKKCVPCWAKRMWGERFGSVYCTDIDTTNTEWANLGFFGSGRELDVSKESALVHSVVFVSVLQCHAHWYGVPINKPSDVQWQLMEAILKNHELCNLRCGMLAMLEAVFRVMKSNTLDSKLQEWNAPNRASDIAMRFQHRDGPKKHQQTALRIEQSDEELTTSWARWASCDEVRKEEEFAYRTLFRELSLYALGCATEKIRQEYTTVMATLFEKDIMTCYCCGPRRILIRSMLGRSRAILGRRNVDVDVKDHEKKLEVLDEVIQHRKTSPTYLFDKAIIFEQKGDLRNAEKDGRKALELLEVPDRQRLGEIEYPENLRRKDRSFMSRVLKFLGDIYNKRAELATTLGRQITLRTEGLKFYHFSRIECPHDTLQSDLIGQCIQEMESKLDLDQKKKALFSIPDDIPAAPKNINPVLDPVPADIQPISMISQMVPNDANEVRESKKASQELESGSTVTQKDCDYENCKEENRAIKSSDPWVEGFCDQLCTFACHKNCWRAFSRETGGGFPCQCIKSAFCKGQIPTKVWFLKRKTEVQKRAEMDSARILVGRSLTRESTGAGSVSDGNTVDDCSKPKSAQTLDTASRNASVSEAESQTNERTTCVIVEKEPNEVHENGIDLSHPCKRMLIPKKGLRRLFPHEQGRSGSGREINSSDILKGIIEVLKLSMGSMHLSGIKDELQLQPFGLYRGEAGRYADEVFSLRELIRMNPDVLSLEKAPYEVPMDPQVAYLGHIAMDINVRGRMKRRSAGAKGRTA